MICFTDLTMQISDATVTLQQPLSSQVASGSAIGNASEVNFLIVYLIVIFNIGTLIYNSGTPSRLQQKRRPLEPSRILQDLDDAEGEVIFSRLKSVHDIAAHAITPSLRVICPTRWTVCADALTSILDNYEVLLST